MCRNARKRQLLCTFMYRKVLSEKKLHLGSGTNSIFKWYICKKIRENRNWISRVLSFIGNNIKHTIDFFIQGDSGSPLLCNKKLSGIVSFGPAKNCGQDHRYPGVYTNVGFFKNWIEKTLSHLKLLTSMKDEVNFDFHKISKRELPKNQPDNNDFKKKSSDSMTNQVNFNFHRHERIHPPTTPPPNSSAISYMYFSRNNYFLSQMIYLQAFYILLLCLIPY